MGSSGSGADFCWVGGRASVWEATDPLTQLPWCLLKSAIITVQESVPFLFICMCSRLSFAP